MQRTLRYGQLTLHEVDSFDDWDQSWAVEGERKMGE
jgi:hypothetical protein